MIIIIIMCTLIYLILFFLKMLNKWLSPINTLIPYNKIVWFPLKFKIYYTYYKYIVNILNILLM